MAIDKKTGKAYKSSVQASMKWSKAHMKQMKFDFNVDTDSDVIEKLLSVPNRVDYVRTLIREDIAKNK